MDRESLCLLLQAAKGLGGSQLRALLRHFGGVQKVWTAEPSGWQQAGLSVEAVRALQILRRKVQSSGVPVEIARQREVLDRLSARVMALGEPEYPPLLAAIPDPPPFLHVRGSSDSLRAPQLAVVGSRRASPPGLDFARELCAAVARAGLVITSGLAIGIDAAAHRGALDAGCPTIAVMATGLEQIYPRRHRRLAEEVLEGGGALVSESAPHSPLHPGHFPARNRLVSGLALGVLVVEAALPSGSLITAGCALDQGREVFAVPWFPRHAGGRGCLRLLRDGATLVESTEDILLALNLWCDPRQLPLLPGQDGPPALAGLDQGGPDERAVWEVLGYQTMSLDALLNALGWPAERLLAALTELEVAGLASHAAGGFLRSR